jgi:hypothetical protein
MVRGLEIFKAHFALFKDRYVLIGGTACTLAMEEAGLEFRATKDLDMVLCVEALDREFGEAFWQFIRKGGYQFQEKSSGKKLFYRFKKPTIASYPEMIELFGRVPEAIKIDDESQLTPLPIDEEISSLSAILLDDDYYSLIHERRREIEGLSVIDHECLIPLKAKAWLELSEERNTGANIDEKDIRKHKNDVIRLSRLLTLHQSISLPESIRLDMGKFLDGMQNDGPTDLKNFNLRNITFEELVDNLRQVFCTQQATNERG